MNDFGYFKAVIENLEKIKPDILITDIKMPGMDGIEISKYIYIFAEYIC